MNDNLHVSFKIYVDPVNNPDDMDNKESGPGNDPHSMDVFLQEVENVKEGIKNMEKFLSSLQKANEEIKTTSSAKSMMELRTQTNTDLDNVLKLAKQINKKLDGLVVANAAQRKIQGNESGSPNDLTRGSTISELIDNLMNMMRGFQGLRIRMETDQKQVIENRYFAITGEKATEEAIDNLISSSEGHEALLYQAMQEHGSGAVLDTVAEIQERRDAMKDIRKSLINLHQILSGMATSVEAQGGGGTGSLPSPTELQSSRPLLPVTATGFPAPKLGGGGRLNDYERETRRQAYVAMVIAFVCSIIIIGSYLYSELDEGKDRSMDPRTGLPT